VSRSAEMKRGGVSNRAQAASPKGILARLPHWLLCCNLHPKLTLYIVNVAGDSKEKSLPPPQFYLPARGGGSPGNITRTNSIIFAE